MRSMRSLVLTLSLALVPAHSGSPPPPLAGATNITDSLEQLFRDYQEWRLAAYPEWASIEGFPGHNHLVEDFRMEAIRGKTDACKQFLERSRKLEAENAMQQSYQNYFEVKS